MISAGFDAHRKDDVNCGYVGLDDHDFHWVTDAIVQVANKHCPGRIVSVLEGGYRIQGGVVSAFARSAAAHVSALAQPSHQRFDKDGTAQVGESVCVGDWLCAIGAPLLSCSPGDGAAVCTSMPL
jgi:acetoin utilization deacetylase AcuC-like enzyme